MFIYRLNEYTASALESHFQKCGFKGEYHEAIAPAIKKVLRSMRSGFDAEAKDEQREDESKPHTCSKSTSAEAAAPDQQADALEQLLSSEDEGEADDPKPPESGGEGLENCEGEIGVSTGDAPAHLGMTLADWADMLSRMHAAKLEGFEKGEWSLKSLGYRSERLAIKNNGTCSIWCPICTERLETWTS